MDKPQQAQWKVLRSDYLHRRPWLTVRKDELELPNGHVIPEYYVLEYPDWVNVIAVTTDDQFVFVRQYRHGIGRTDYELCAGVCDPEDGSPLEAARRELEEETGYGGGDWKEFMVLSANPATNTNMTYCYLATGVERVATPHPEDSEDLSVHLLPFGEVRRMLGEGLVIPALHAAPLWKYMALHG